MVTVKLCNPILPCVHLNVNSSYIKSFAVDKLLAAVAKNFREWFRLGGLSAAADGSGSGDYPAEQASFLHCKTVMSCTSCLRLGHTNLLPGWDMGAIRIVLIIIITINCHHVISDIAISVLKRDVNCHHGRNITRV